MNKSEFLTVLICHLGHLPKEERDEVIFDYDEHFRLGIQDGKSEEHIAEALGDPKILAKQFSAGYALRQAESTASASNIFKAVLAVVGLGFFNLVFVLGPFLALVGVIAGLFAAAFGVTIAGITLFFGALLAPHFPLYINIGVNSEVTVFASIGLTSLGLLFMIGVIYLAKLFYKAILEYLKLNMKVIKA